MWNNNCHVTSYTKKNSYTKPPNGYIRWEKLKVTEKDRNFMSGFGYIPAGRLTMMLSKSNKDLKWGLNK